MDADIYAARPRLKAHSSHVSTASLIRLFLCQLVAVNLVSAYVHPSCSGFGMKRQFQLPNCFVPDVDPSLPLASVSFLMSHDAATGYMNHIPTDSVEGDNGAGSNGKNSGPSRLAALYAKTQVGNAFQQLDHGARALDLRPKLLANGTVVFHHGIVNIAVSAQILLRDVKAWAAQNPNELVLLFHSNLAYEDSSFYDDGSTAVAAMSAVYNGLGMAYVQCGDVYGLTVQETLELAAVTSSDGSQKQGQGYILALDRHDFYLSSCTKSNYVSGRLVHCYENRTVACTKKSKSPLFDKLHQYLLESANNDPSDSSSSLGPPATPYDYPFSQLQGIWQVDAYSATMGIAHLSNLIDDNTKSAINARLVDWVHADGYDESERFSFISILTVDQVRLNGNALLSVLRTQCGQFDTSEFGVPCGSALAKPRLRHQHFSTALFAFRVAAATMLCVVFAIALRHYRRYHQPNKGAMEEDLLVATPHALPSRGAPRPEGQLA